MTERHEQPLSPLDEQIERLLGRLSSLEAHVPAPEERPIQEVAIRAIRSRLKELSRRCTDRTCRIRVLEEVKKKIQDFNSSAD